MRYSFIHAADLHIDSPLESLGSKDSAVARRFAHAGRTAVQSLIAETIRSGAAFLIIAGDIFDGDWRDVSSGLFFVKMLGELRRANIPVYLIRGNHDAESNMSRSLLYPDNVHVFGSGRATTQTLDALRVALHGRSFGNRAVPDDFVDSYPVRREGWLNIGILHTALDGTRGHASYAPCDEARLRGFSYDYWALGHIHARAIVSQDPWIVFPGNIQGRSIRETGPRGATRVSVEDGRIVNVEALVLDAARWERADIDVSDCRNEDDILAKIDSAIGASHASAGDRPLALRIEIAGPTSLHNMLVTRSDILQDDARALGLRYADDCWVESLRIATREPDSSRAHISELGQLLRETTDTPEYAALLDELVQGVAAKMPRDLRDDFTRQAHATLARDAGAFLEGRVAPEPGA